jgi:outer membrane protein TolC
MSCRAPFARGPVWLAGLALALSAAAEPLSLQECVRLALRSSPALDTAAVRVELARERLREARSKLGLTFDARSAFGVVPNDDEGNGLGPFVRNELNFTQPLSSFGKVRAGRSAAESGILAAEEQARIDRDKLVLEVTKLYWLALLARDLEELAGEAEDRVAKALNKAQELFDQASGKVTQRDLAKLKVFNAKLRSQALAARTGVELSRSALALAIGLDDPSKLDLGEVRLQAPEQPPGDLAALRQLGLARRPELEALRRGIAAREALERVERRKYLPDLGIVGTLRYAVAPERTIQDEDPNARDDFNLFNYGAAFGLRLGLGFREQQGRIRQAEADLRLIRSQFRQAEQGVGLEIEKAYREAIETAERVRVTREGLKAARGWMLAETQLYQIGTGETKDLLEALGAYAETKKDSLEALQRAQAAAAELRRVIGEEPDLSEAPQP